MKNNSIIKILISSVLLGCLFPVCLASTTQKGRDIIETLREDERPDDEIRPAITDLGYNANEYLGKSSNSSLTVIHSNSSSNTTAKTTAQGRKILNQYRNDGRTDEKIKQAMEEAGLDTSGYFPENNTNSSSTSSSDLSKYTSRSCKTYTIEYVSSLNAYTSPNLLRNEYFVNIDYLKRYIDSKNTQNSECYIDGGWISTSYVDTYNGTDRYTAPNGKIYFIKQENGRYTSNELSSPRAFQTIDELKNYIKERNPLISMGVTNSKNQDAITELWNELFD